MTSSLIWIAGVGAGAAALSLFRFAINLGFVERPLLVGLGWGALFGDLPTCLAMGLFFELFWLDLFPVGTFIPPHSAAATLAALSLASYFGLRHPGEVVLPLMVALPFGLLGARMEILQRTWQNRAYDRLVRTDGDRRGTAGPVVAWSLIQTAGVQFFVFSGALALSVAFIQFFGVQVAVQELHLPIGWGHLWLLAAVGAILSLRVKKSYLVLGGAAILLPLLPF